MSPLHYQKVLRLSGSRAPHLSRHDGREHRSQRVGYLSASQFSREYTASSEVRQQKTSPDCAKTGPGPSA